MNRPYAHQRNRSAHKPVEVSNDAGLQFTITMQDIVAAMTRPSVLYQPDLTLDKKTLIWKATYGDFSVFGPTPGLAMHNFDAAWMTRKTFDASASVGSSTE